MYVVYTNDKNRSMCKFTSSEHFVNFLLPHQRPVLVFESEPKEPFPETLKIIAFQTAVT